MAPDIVNLFQPPNATPTFAQGTLVTFDPLTGDNTVNVLGQVFTNLALLNVPDVVNMVAGSVVMLAQLGGSYAIMGRVVVPGSALLNTAAVAFDQASVSAFGFSIPTGVTVVGTATVNVPAWANQISFMASGNISGVNSTGSLDILGGQLRYSGSFGTGTGGGVQTEVPAGSVGCVTCSAAQHALGVTPGETITFAMLGNTSLGTWTSGANAAFIDSLCVFQRH